ncbi:MAG: FG-GAP repeat protein, partial [Flavobacterium sp.]|nr:FG-GAP repeat protein [Flavobacterium sp.]
MKKITFLLSLVFNISFGQNLTGFSPTNGANGSQFGYKTDADNNNILVASQNNLNPINNIGKVYLFENTENGILQTNTFYPSDALESDEFGSSISIKNDFIAVGSPKNDELGENAGAVYIYKKTNNVWVFSQKITAFNGVVDDNFGQNIKLVNNFLFITSNPINTIAAIPTNEIVYIYNFDGTNWVFTQMILNTSADLSFSKIDFDGNSVLTEQIGFTHIFKKFVLVGSFWEFQNQIIIGNLEENINDFTFNNNKIYVLSDNLNNGCNVKEFSELNNEWQITNTIPIVNFNDQNYTTLEVQNDKLFLGSTSYIFQYIRKFPVLYFKKIGGTWTFQNMIYGNTALNEDDYFGESICTTNDLLIIGAPKEGIIQSGKSYATQLSTLGIKKIDNSVSFVYPNPTKDKLYVQHDEINPIKKI